MKMDFKPCANHFAFTEDLSKRGAYGLWKITVTTTSYPIAMRAHSLFNGNHTAGDDSRNNHSHRHLHVESFLLFGFWSLLPRRQRRSLQRLHILR